MDSLVELENFAKIASSTSNGGNETDFGFRDEQVFIKRLVATNKETAQKDASLKLLASGSYYQTILKEKGLLDSIGFRQVAPFEIGDHDVEIDVKAFRSQFQRCA